MEPLLQTANNLAVRSEQLFYTTPSHETYSLKLEQIIFVLQPPTLPGRQQEYVICGLQESTTPSEQPFVTQLLRATEVPDRVLELCLIKSFSPYLLETEANRVDIIVSIKSGTGLAKPFWQNCLAPLWTTVQQVLLPDPSQPGSAVGSGATTPRNLLITDSNMAVRSWDGLTKESSWRSPAGGQRTRTVVLLSGDGAVVDLLNGVPYPQEFPIPTLVLLPLGTGNALFQSLHKLVSEPEGPSPLVLALRTLFKGVAADLPTFRAEFTAGSRMVVPPAKDEPIDESPTASDVASQRSSQLGSEIDYLLGSIVASYGFHASIVYESDTPAYRVHGDKRFGMVAQDLLREAHPYAARLETRQLHAPQGDFTPVPRSAHAYILATLVSNLERAFTISPRSNALDGRLWLVHFGAVGGERIMEAMMAAYDGGKHVGLKWDDGEQVSYEEVEEVRITALDGDARWRKVCVDGTIVELPEGGAVTVSRGGRTYFRVLVDPRVLPGAI